MKNDLVDTNTERTSALSKRRLIAGSLLGCALLLSGTLLADDWPQWRGPARTGQATDFEPPGVWPNQLTLVWEREAGPGDTSPVVADGRVFVFSRDGDQETMTAYSLEDGSVLWRDAYDAPFEPLQIVLFHGDGPYSTPTVAGGRVFANGIGGIVTAWEADTGKRIWQNDWQSDFKRTRPFYGAAQSPLVDGDTLYLHIGGPGDGAFSAIDPATGKIRWQWKGDGPAYASPTIVEIAGTRQIVTLAQRSFVGLDLEGNLLWQMPYQVSFDNTNLTPVVLGDLVFMSAYQTPLKAYRISKSGNDWSIEQAWSNESVWMQFSSPVLAGDRLVAFSTRKSGQYVAVDPATGRTIWEGPGRSGELGYLIAVDDLVFGLTSTADLMIFDASQDSFRPLAEYEVASSAVWSHPALLQNKLVIKGKTELRVFEVRP